MKESKEYKKLDIIFERQPYNEYGGIGDDLIKVTIDRDGEPFGYFMMREDLFTGKSCENLACHNCAFWRDIMIQANTGLTCGPFYEKKCTRGC